MKRNPVTVSEFAGGPVMRVFVGRKIGKTVAITREMVAQAIIDVLRAQGMFPGMTVIDTQGVYAPRKGVVIEEPSTEVILFCPADESYASARERAAEIGLVLAAKLDQEFVLIELESADGTKRELLGASVDKKEKAGILANQKGRRVKLSLVS